jgi:hypothetical protein
MAGRWREQPRLFNQLNALYLQPRICVPLDSLVKVELPAFFKAIAVRLKMSVAVELNSW